MGHVWLGTNLGLDCFDYSDGPGPHSYGLAEGFLGQETNQNAVLPDQGGQLWVGTINGLMHYDPALARPNRAAPRTVRGRPAYFSERHRAGTGTGACRTGSTTSRSTIIGVSLTNPGKVRYQYRLVGFDPGWVGPI